MEANMAGSVEGKPTSFEKAVRLARKRGVEDPLVECHEHGVKLRLSELSPIALLALEAGLDAEGECLLISK
jgi:hypothetical protein